MASSIQVRSATKWRADHCAGPDTVQAEPKHLPAAGYPARYAFRAPFIAHRTVTHTPAIFQLPLAIPFWIIFFFAFVREAKVVQPALGEKPSAQDSGTFRALMIGSPIAVLAAGTAAYLPWLTIPSPVAAVVIATILIVAGAVLRRYCFCVLGTSFTGVVTVKQDQRIVESGLYRLVRHPSYTAAFMMFTGLGLALGSWISVAILFFAHCYLYGRRVVAEENALVETLGAPCTEYMLRTKRFIPFLV